MIQEKRLLSRQEHLCMLGFCDWMEWEDTPTGQERVCRECGIVQTKEKEKPLDISK